MKKFKIIETSRFLQKDKMAQIEGGLYSCPDMHQILCVDNHAYCNAAPMRYMWGVCAKNHITCGYLVFYGEYCATVHLSCGLITPYSN